MRHVFALVVLVGLVWLPASAVVVAGSSGTGNTTAPADDPGFANVGVVNGASGVYLGSFETGYWVLTATHVGFGDITLGGVTYSAIAGSGVQVGGDLYAYRIESDPGLATLTFSASSPITGSTVVMIGNGRNRASELNYWSVTGTAPEYAWTAVSSTQSYNAAGYAYASGSAIRWGTNTIDSENTYNLGTGLTNGLLMDFDARVGEAMGAPGDSGGALFYKNGSTWELAGILSGIYSYDNQPSGTSVFGNLTVAVDLASYYTTLTSLTGAAAIPEPATMTLAFGVVVGGVVGYRRRRAARIC